MISLSRHLVSRVWRTSKPSTNNLNIRFGARWAGQSHAPTPFKHTRRRGHINAAKEPLERPAPGNVPEFFSGPWFWIKTLWIGVNIGALIHLFMQYVLQPRSTIGPSMLPTLDTQYDRVYLCPLYARGRGIKVGDVVSFTHPVRGEYSGIKRIIGMPGDLVLRDTPPDTDYFHNPHPLEPDDDPERHMLRLVSARREHRMVRVPEGHCWVVGDNFDMSRDSRMYGPVPLALIRGKVLAAWGEQGFRLLRNPLRS